MRLSEKKRFINTIGNTSRLKILLALWKTGRDQRIYRICKLTGLGRSSVRCHLNNLVENKLVLKKLYGQICLYSINMSDSRTRTLANFFQEVRL